MDCYVSGETHFIQIDFPYDDLTINNSIRVYIMYTSLGYDVEMKKYFIIRRFKDGAVHILYVNEDGKQLLGEQIVPTEGIEKEHARILQTYLQICADMK